MAKEDFEIDEDLARLLKQVGEDYWKEDAPVRERQVRKYRHLKLLWDGFSRVWWDDVAHDWRVFDVDTQSGDGDQDYYDKPVNIFRAYLETIIAALSVVVPPVKCYPDDADNPLDLLTAKAGDKIGQLIFRHNNAPLLWLQALFIYATEGMVAAHHYTKESDEYGSVDVHSYEDEEEAHRYSVCPLCQTQMADEVINQEARNNINPDDSDVPLHSLQDEDMEMCQNCMKMVSPQVSEGNVIVQRLTDTTTEPKSRQCIEVYGGLYVKVANYAKKQCDTPYLIQSYETNYALARSYYPWIREKIQPNAGIDQDPYEVSARLNNVYRGEYPNNNVTIRSFWLRPCAFETLQETAERDKLVGKFPDGARLVMVNDNVAYYKNEKLDDAWTLTENPLSDFLVFDPIGMGLISSQEITNDIISLTQQTIEHGIPQTFADQAVLDFKGYGQTEATPGGIYPATAKSGKSVGDGFYEVKTATLSQEVLPFLNLIQSLAQTVIGAQPSLFGGQLEGSKTASEYSMSRAQALQRLQNTWKMFTSWWKGIYTKVIPAYIDDMKDDEKFVQQDQSGNFMNVYIKKAETEGKIGSIELEANENLPVTWSQKKDMFMALLENQNPMIAQIIMNPENLPLVYEALGVPELFIPGEDSRTKQYTEIKELLLQEPVIEEPTEIQQQIGQMVGQEVQPTELPSVPVDEFDNHQVELEICVKWINSEAGQQAKVDNPPGYMNVCLHARQHKQKMMEEMMASVAPEGSAPEEKPEENTETPITEDNDVSTVA